MGKVGTGGKTNERKGKQSVENPMDGGFQSYTKIK
jgi:hypothetical protein